MIIKAATPMTYPIYRQFYRFNLVQGKRTPWQGRLLLVLGPLLLAGFIYLYQNNPADPMNLIGTILLATFSLLLYAIVFFVPRLLFRAISQKPGQPDHFTFTDEGIEASAGPESPAGPAVVNATPYALLYRAFETRAFFYIYVSLNQVYIIGKSDITQGSAEDLRELLQARLRVRFQVVDRS
jgi:hypothetical protein